MKLKLLILTFVSFCRLTYSQNPRIDFTIHSRVDTSKQEIKEIVALWINYLSSKPDSIYDNPYWNAAEKLEYADFDFTRAYMYQIPSLQLLDYYKPTILSVEEEGANYAIRTLFSADKPEGIYKKSNPWCITRLYAVKENKQWRLMNAFPVLTKNWERKTVGKINFIYSSEHRFSAALAKKANKFCDSVALKFQLPYWKPFDFYITQSGDEMGKLLGFDFFFAGYTNGIGMNDRRILFSGYDTEWYPHEFVHMLVENKERHRMIDEGFATWLGGEMGISFEESAKILAQQMSKNDTVTFDDILNVKWGSQFVAYYTTGAILCKLAYGKGGVDAVKKLLDTPAENDMLIQTICDLFKINKPDLDTFLRTEILNYLMK